MVPLSHVANHRSIKKRATCVKEWNTVRYSMKVGLLLSLLCAGCRNDSPLINKPPQPEKQAVVLQGYQRFVTIRLPNPGTNEFSDQNVFEYALDTKTGQLCRTWDWTTLNAKPKATTDRTNVPTRLILY